MKILYVEDNAADADLTRRTLARTAIALTVAPTLAAANEILADGTGWDLVLTDVNLPDGTGLDLLLQIRERHLDLPVVIITGFGEEDLAVGAIKAGADDFVIKREGYLERLPAVLDEALRRYRDTSRRHATPLNVLYAEANENDAHNVAAHFSHHAPYLRLDMVTTADCVLRLGTRLELDRYQAIVLDCQLPNTNVLGLLKELRQGFKIEAPVVLVAGQGEEELASESLRFGAADFLIKRPGYLFQLPQAIENAYYRAKEKRDWSALRESEERYRSLFDGAIDGMALVDAETGVITACNEALLQLVGRSREEIIGTPETSLHPPRKPGMLALATLRAEVGSQNNVGLTVVTDRTGEQRPVEIKSSELTLHGRRVWLGVFRDVTERLIAERDLRLRNTALEAAANSIVITDRCGNVVWTNPAFTLATGYTQAEVVGKNPRVLKSGEQPSEFYSTLWQTIAAGHTWEGEFINLRKDGTRMVEHATITPVRNELGKITNFIAVKQDVTERRQAEQRIHDLAQLLDLANDAIIVCDPHHIVTRWNLGAERLYGWTEAEVLGQNLHLLLRDSRADNGEITHALWLKGNWNGELRQKTNAGKEVIVSSRWTLIRDAQNEPKNILILNADITEKKNLEAQFLRMQRVESIGTLAAGIAHDLNNILAPILMVAPLLEDKIKDDEARWMLESTRKNAERGAAIVKQLLTFAKGSEGEKVPLQLTRLVKDTIGIIRETFPKNIQCESNLAPNLWSVCGNLTQLHQVLLNLCVNARDAMPEGGHLAIALTNTTVGDAVKATELNVQPGPFVVLAVTDSGTGIPDEIKDRIFDPFFTTKGPDKGTGLGLATVLGIIRGHGGFVQVESRLGQGTQFKVFLPATGVNEAGQDQEQVVPPDQGRGELILVVDDEAPIRDTCRRVLTKFGYRVVEAENGQVALQIFQANSKEIDLVLTDLQMPAMGGPAFIRTLRQHAPAAKILAATGYGAKSAIEEINQLGVCGILNKPFTPTDLISAVQASLSNKPIPTRHPM
jgi:PAS domain S-box-containing protein